MAIDERISRIEDRLARVEARLAENSIELKEARADVHELVVAISGPPREDSLRGRLHKLEDSDATAKAAEAALTAARAFYERRNDKRFSHREKLAGLAVAAAVLVSQWVAPLVTHAHH